MAKCLRGGRENQGEGEKQEPHIRFYGIPRGVWEGPGFSLSPELWCGRVLGLLDNHRDRCREGVTYPDRRCAASLERKVK